MATNETLKQRILDLEKEEREINAEVDYINQHETYGDSTRAEELSLVLKRLKEKVELRIDNWNRKMNQLVDDLTCRELQLNLG